MRCTSCGYEIADGVAFCPNCGTNTAVVPQNTNDQSTSIMIMGILSLVFSGIVGLILAIITKNKVKAHLEQGGSLTGKAKVGNTLAKVGLIFSIIGIISLALYCSIYGVLFILMLMGM